MAGVLKGHSAGGNRHILLAPVEWRVIFLPDQFGVPSRAVSGNRVCHLLVNEVGLGNTVETGLTMRQVKLRGPIVP